LCKSAERSKVSLARKTREEKTRKNEDGNVVEKTETVKLEEVIQDIPVNADAESEVRLEGESDETVEDGVKPPLDEIANGLDQLVTSGRKKTKR